MRFDKGFWIILLRVMFAVILLLNVATVLTALSIYEMSPTEEPQPTQEDGSEDRGELDEDLGGFTQVTGILTYLIIFLMLIFSIGLFRGQVGALLGSSLTIALDSAIKSYNVVAELFAGTSVGDLWIAFVVIALEIAVSVGFYLAYRDRRHAMGESADYIGEEASHGHGADRERIHHGT